MNLNELIASSGLAQRDDLVARTSDGARFVYLHAGQMLVAAHATHITTVLGSCVAICLWDPALSIGGMNHYMLPMNPASRERAMRFGDSATRALIDAMVAAGASLHRLEAKVFGGASVLAIAGSVLGRQNIDTARQELADRRIPIVGEDVGGTKGRKLVFRTDTGLSMVKTV